MSTYTFDAEISKVLTLVINSLYTNKDIFLRELISNASDACDKLRYLSLQDPKYKDYSDFKITIAIDKNNNTISISDNGIGMDETDLQQALGTIAASGTQKFAAMLDQQSKPDFIGQFGVGFYSAFMVAKQIDVYSRKACDLNSYIWSCKGLNEYTIAKLDENIDVGTRIVLHLKEDASGYLDAYRIKHIVQVYCDHIAMPIELLESNEAEVINKASAIWSRQKSEITDEQYNEFYRHVSHQPDTPWLKVHTTVEGAVSYTALLFIPSIKPFDLFHPDRKTSVKLYVKKVFITEEGEIVPRYLRFLRGIIDSADLPLNISRETLQHDSQLNKIRKSIVKKVLSELKTKVQNDPTAYEVFWQNFGEVLKEGLCEPMLEEKEQLLEICQFHSALLNKPITLEQYKANSLEQQKSIFFITGDNLAALATHPQIEGFIKRGIDVLLLNNHVDDFWVTVTPKFKDYDILNVNSSEIDLNAIKQLEEETKDNEDNMTTELDTSMLVSYFKNTLADAVKDVKASSKLIESPACITVPEGGMSSRMERYLVEQKQMNKLSAKILEINTKHKIMQKILNSIKNNANDNHAADMAWLVFDQACIVDGEQIIDTNAFCKRLNSVLANA